MNRGILCFLCGVLLAFTGNGQTDNNQPSFSMGVRGVISWGGANTSALNSKVPLGLDLNRVKKVYAGFEYGLALNENGTVVGWGNKDIVEAIPEGLSNVISLDLNYRFVIAVLGDGDAIAWGKLPDGLADFLGSLTNVKMIDYSVAPDRCLILKNDGTLKMWGKKIPPHLNLPDDLKDVKSITSGDHFNVALKENGTVVAWGSSAYVSMDFAEGLKNAVAVSASRHHVIVLLSNGEVLEWGGNKGAYGLPHPTNLNNMILIQAGPGISHDIGLREDGIPVVWGLDYASTPAPPPKWLHGVSWVSVGFSQHNLAVAPTRSLRVLNDGKLREIKNFAYDISPGSEAESRQKVRFEVRFDHSDFFKEAPTIDEKGTLTFRAKRNIGQSEITVVAVDDGPEINGSNRSVPRTVTLFVVEDEVDPSAITDDYEVWQNHVLNTRVSEGVLINDLSVEPSTMVATLVEEPAHGSLKFHKHGGFCYTPNTDFLGEDYFIYRFVDSVGKSNSSKVTLKVSKPIPIPPVKLSLSETFTGGGSVAMNLHFKVASEYVYYFDTSNDLTKPWRLGEVSNVGSWQTIFHQSNFWPANLEGSHRFIRLRVDYNRGGCTE